MAIFRLPQTSRSTTGFTQPSDTAVRLYAAIADVQMLPGGFSFQRQNHTVDTLSRICTAIAASPERQFTLYHCCNPNPVHHDLELADFGLYLREGSYDSFKRACHAHGESSPLHGYWALFDHFAPYWFSDTKTRSPVPVCDRAMREDCPFPIEWPGALTMFRRTNDWIREHRQQWPFALSQPQLDYDRLMMRAERYAERMDTPFAQTYPDWIRNGLEHLVQALQAPEARLLEAKRGVAVSDLSRSLRSNAALAGERRRHPEIDREQLTRPVFIVGINRTAPRSCTACWRGIRASGPCAATSWPNQWWRTARTRRRGLTPTYAARVSATCSRPPGSPNHSPACINSTSTSPRRTSGSCDTPSRRGPTPTSTMCRPMAAGSTRPDRGARTPTTAAPCSTSPGSGTSCILGGGLNGCSRRPFI